MLSALTNISGMQHVATGRPQVNAARTETAAAALAALSPAQPLPSVSDPIDEDGFSFLYRPNGLPSGADASPLAVPQAATNGSSAPSRLAVESTQLSSLLSSLMSAAPTASSAVSPAATEPSGAQETLIVKLYQQF
ncbi:hypothetical protein J2Y48_002587 [Mycoplana sp. BE70]|uniref:hypothetical protein n=1 Tax=Mycoplana sp. BE70 TaxID=2817775 RepID=UPI0028578560|nr:hypothetical protein [Mycoplana sp. BE70]MDR6757291.1 hypothetical protein [Mycoplana sp. BE70]